MLQIALIRIQITLICDTNYSENRVQGEKIQKKKAAMRGCGLPGMPANRH